MRGAKACSSAGALKERRWQRVGKMALRVHSVVAGARWQFQMTHAATALILAESGLRAAGKREGAGHEGGGGGGWWGGERGGGGGGGGRGPVGRTAGCHR